MASDSVDQYIPFFGRDFLASTAMWSADEVGHYIRLLIIQWDHGHLPDDLGRLERVSPGIGEVWATLEVKFPVGDDGHRRNLRMEEHRERAMELKQARSSAGRAGAAQRWGKNGKGNGKRNGNRIDLPLANGMAKRWPPSPSPNKEITDDDNAAPIRETGQSASSSSDFLSDDPREAWAEFRAAWEASPKAAPLPPAIAKSLDPPRVWLDLFRSDEHRQALDALGQLAECRFFEKPIPLSQFLGKTWGQILAGGYREKPKARGAPDDKPPPKSWLEQYQPAPYRRPKEVVELAAQLKRASKGGE